MNNTVFAERLREARTAAKLTQADLSKKAGVTAATISAYESSDGNKGKNPSLENALKLAEGLNVSLDWLCGFSIKTDKAPIVDFLKMLVSLDDFSDISFDNVNFDKTNASNVLPNAYMDIDDDDMMIEQQYCEQTGKVFEYCLYVATFHNCYIQGFICDWQKMRALYKSKTIDKDLYNLWLNKQFKDIEFQINKEDLILITNDKTDGDSNGNDQETE